MTRVRNLVLPVVLAVVVLASAAAAATAHAAPPVSHTPKADSAWPVHTVTTTQPAQTRAQFTAVSCPQTTFCLAVGRHVAADGLLAPLTETFDGKTWHLGTTSLPGIDVSEFDAVSCISKSFCVATAKSVPSGRWQVATWNGKTWTPRSLGAPDVLDLTGLQCRTTSFCMLVGVLGTYDGSDPTRAAAWHFNGSSWTQQELVRPGSHILSSVSCPTTKLCYAAGFVQDSMVSQAPSMQRWNGTVWQPVSLPGPTSYGYISDIACAASTRCTAVGTGGPVRSGPLVLDLSGATWKYSKIQGTAHTAFPGAEVSCTAASCTAVLRLDENPDVDGAAATVIAVRGAKGGFVQSSQKYHDLADVSCVGTWCIVVGSTLLHDSYHRLGNTPTPATAYRPHGLTLNAFPVSQPAGRAPSDLTSVSCAGSLCAAVSQTDTARSLWLRKTTSSAWAPVPGTADVAYTAVSCTSETFCLAVGQGTALRYDGSTWTTSAVPTPAGKDKGFLLGVSCVSSAWCEGVGKISSSSGRDWRSFAARWSNGSWTLDTVPTPAGDTASLVGVSCSAVGDCLAVGHHLRGTTWHPLVEQVHDATWTLADTSGLAASHDLAGVSCWAANGCMTVGDSSEYVYGIPGYAGTWDGATFTSHPLPGTSARPLAVSCTAATSCTVTSPNVGAQPIEHWD